MAFKLLEMAQERWKRLNGAELLPLVRAGVQFIDGKQPDRDDAEQEQVQEQKQKQDTTERAVA